jgi:type VI secretion system protein ImpC
LATWIGLALPRLLVRLPYGAATDPVESFAFEELAGDRRHEHYLWGNPAYALAFLTAQAFSEEGWEMEVASRLVIEDLPSHVYRDEDGEAQQQACAEVWLSESVAEAILDRGVMPILSYRNRNAARLLRWQSVSMPPKALAGIMTT